MKKTGIKVLLIATLVILTFTIMAQEKEGIVLIKSDPAGAQVLLDGTATGKYTPFQSLLSEGKHAIKLILENYSDLDDVINVKPDDANTYKFTLKSAFGSLFISSNPPGAAIYLDGKKSGQLTPAHLSKILPGERLVRIEKENYRNMEETILVVTEKETSKIFDLNAGFGTVGIITKPEAEIQIDDVRVGFGQYSGKLIPGKHTIGVSSDKYFSIVREVTIDAGSESPILFELIPKTGKLAVMTDPIELGITINGVPAGNSPVMRTGLLIGEYLIGIKTIDGEDYFVKTTIHENQLNSLAINLSEFKNLPTLKVNSCLSKLNISLQSISKNTGNWGVYVGSNNRSIDFKNSHYSLPSNNNNLEISDMEVGKTYCLRPFFKIGDKVIYGNSIFTSIKPIEFDMILIDNGYFQMGSNVGGSDEKPIHTVALQSFFISKYEVTQAQWETVMGSNPSVLKDGTLPVENVNWNDVQNFILKLNQTTGKKFRLPTEAEWNFAANGGINTKKYDYSGSNNLDEVAWYVQNSELKTHQVGQKKPNELGLYDMSGNVGEWCSDWYAEYSSSTVNDPPGPTTGLFHIIRGGNWMISQKSCRTSQRFKASPEYHDSDVGFRLVSTD